MQLTVDIPYEQLINIIRHLPANQRAKIKSDLEHSVAVNNTETEKTNFREFLLKGPVMTDDQYSDLKENKAFKWFFGSRVNDFRLSLLHFYLWF